MTEAERPGRLVAMGDEEELKLRYSKREGFCSLLFLRVTSHRHILTLNMSHTGMIMVDTIHNAKCSRNYQSLS